MELKRNSVIALFLAGKTQPAIVRELKHLKVNKMFVYRTISRYNETGSIADRHRSGRIRTATSKEMVRRVKARIERKPRTSAAQMAKGLKISRRSVGRILENELQLKPYKMQKVHELDERKRLQRFERATELIRLHESGELPNIVFSDEKIFTVQQKINKQNDRVWLKEKSSKNLDIRIATRTQKPKSVMVWAAVSADFRSPLVFVNPGITVNATEYREIVLEGALLPWLRKTFGDTPFTFQQDSAPSHRAKVNQNFLREHGVRLISEKQWLANSPDANPMDFCVWSMLEARVCTKRYDSLDALKVALRREWAKIPQSHIRAACNSFIPRLHAIKKAKGNQIEQS